MAGEGGGGGGAHSVEDVYCTHLALSPGGELSYIHNGPPGQQSRTLTLL